jgi:putative ABC transport system substrate-binding protein
MQRRKFLTFGGASAITTSAWQGVPRAQQRTLPVVGFVNAGSADGQARNAAAFRRGLNETGYVDGQNVAIEYLWLEGQYERLPSLVQDLARRRVAVIAAIGNTPALAAKNGSQTVPIVFAVTDDPVKLGLVPSLARPAGNATGINFFLVEVTAKRLGLLHELLPRAARIAVLVNPGSPQTTELTIKEVQDAATNSNLQIHVFKAGTSSEIEAAFAAIARDKLDALFVATDAFYGSRPAQFATLAARDRLPTSYAARLYVEAGGLMSYGTDLADSLRHVGIYAGNILKGTKPADLPVVQSTKFEFVINLQTARLLGIEVPPGLLAIADEVIE